MPPLQLNDAVRKLDALWRTGVSRHPLLKAAARSGWEPRPAEWELLTDLEHELLQRPDARIALLVGKRASPLGAVLREAFPRAQQWVADLDAEPDVLHTRLAARGPYDVIIDDSRRVAARLRIFRDAFWHLATGGIYVVRDFRKKPWPDDVRPEDSQLWPYLTGLLQLRRRGRPAKPGRRAQEELHRARSLGRLVLGSEHIIVENRGSAYAKIREAAMAEVITARADDRAGLIMTRPGGRFRSRATLLPARLHEADRRFARDYEIPPLSVRRYADAVVVGQQVVLQGNLMLPETFRHHLYRNLTNRRLDDLTRYFAAVDDLGTPERLTGRYFHLDSEYPGHFGHVITEPLSRLWAWPELKRRWPDLRAITSLPRRARRSPAFALELFAAAGVAPEDVVAVDRPVIVDELIGVTPMASMPTYIHPDIADLWLRMGDRLAEGAPARDWPERIFVTRRPGTIRECHNGPEVEARFAAAGFTVVRPEMLPLPEQVQMFRRAAVIAGFGGSGMFNLMFRTEPATVIVLRPTSYTSVNEYMISSVLGNRVIYIDSEPDLDHPDGGWTYDAFRSGFTFRPDREGRQLEQVLAGL